MNQQELIQKYAKTGPRYTSYPTVPNWNSEAFNEIVWETKLASLSENQLKNEGISIYVHLPYCESLCTFCACHKRITKNHGVEVSYIAALLSEWQLYLRAFGTKPTINEIHLGGGTPSFFSAENLKMLINGILKEANVSENKAFSFEGHPNNTTEEHLLTLYNLGFRRVSFGVQDFDNVVQKSINRIQSFETVKNITQISRDIGYTSISLDLVFGLPFQTEVTIKDTIFKTLQLRPDRIAFYSYAHVPWIKGNGQRGFNDEDLPKPNEKRKLYELGLQMFEDSGYSEIGMDHFALPYDELFIAMKNGVLHRNFMGYTTQTSKNLIGLGASAISEIYGAFSQNIKDINLYKQAIQASEFPVEKGHELSPQDQFVKSQIRNLMCDFETKWTLEDMNLVDFDTIFNNLEEFQDDGLLSFTNNSVKVNEIGKPFVRNICMVFDQYLNTELHSEKLFSQTI